MVCRSGVPQGVHSAQGLAEVPQPAVQETALAGAAARCAGSLAELSELWRKAWPWLALPGWRRTLMSLRPRPFRCRALRVWPRREEKGRGSPTAYGSEVGLMNAGVFRRGSLRRACLRQASSGSTLRSEKPRPSQPWKASSTTAGGLGVLVGKALGVGDSCSVLRATGFVKAKGTLQESRQSEQGALQLMNR